MRYSQLGWFHTLQLQLFYTVLTLESRLSTYTPVHLRDRVSVQAVAAFTAEARGSEQSRVDLEEGEEEQEGSRGIPGKPY